MIAVLLESTEAARVGRSRERLQSIWEPVSTEAASRGALAVDLGVGID